MIDEFSSYFRAPADIDVVRRQMQAFTRQAPLLYLILNVNVIALAYTHYGLAPSYLTLYAPGLLFAICTSRVVVWLRTAGRDMTDAQARLRLKASYMLTGILGISFTFWALCLYDYGNLILKSHVAFFMSITVIGCTFCLMHMRPAALLLTGIVTVPFLLRFATTGEPVFTAIAFNFCFVVVAMIYILFTYYEDFTSLVHSEKNLVALSDENYRMASHDSLTSLPNRRSFFQELDQRDGTGFAVGMIDLDGFKPVNDVHGHAAGDCVLVEVGRRLQALLGTTGLVARLGGDEFGIVVPMEADELHLVRLGGSICAAIQAPILLPNGVAQVSASIGFALPSGTSAHRNHLIERADYALNHAKTTSRGTAVVFSETHETAIRTQSLMEQELRRADFDAEMSMRYQPIVEAGSDEVIAYEALARWENPILGHVPPVDFIAAAERTGLINRLTEVLFAKSLRAALGWPAQVGLSFNLSARDLASIDLITRIGVMIEESGIDARRIAFEITETALLQDFAQSRAMLLRLKSLGVKISLDDFGTGYSSLLYVHRLPFDKIKVDRGFVVDLVTEKASRDIVSSIVGLCRNLNLACIVEGVETAEQVLILRALGCVTMQGYFFGRPSSDPVYAVQDGQTVPGVQQGSIVHSSFG